MKANGFVKLRGINYCKELLIRADGCSAIQAREDNSRVSVDDLKRLVESYELVEAHGGLPQAREVAHKNCFEYPMRLLQAIVDVESCQ